MHRLEGGQVHPQLAQVRAQALDIANRLGGRVQLGEDLHKGLLGVVVAVLHRHLDLLLDHVLVPVDLALEAGDDACGVAGVSHLNGQLRHEPPRGLIDDLDSLPFPARQLIDRQAYWNPKLGVRPVAAVIASRNCRFRCTYCVPCSLSCDDEPAASLASAFCSP